MTPCAVVAAEMRAEGRPIRMRRNAVVAVPDPRTGIGVVRGSHADPWAACVNPRPRMEGPETPGRDQPGPPVSWRVQIHVRLGVDRRRRRPRGDPDPSVPIRVGPLPLRWGHLGLIGRWRRGRRRRGGVGRRRSLYRACLLVLSERACCGEEPREKDWQGTEQPDDGLHDGNLTLPQRNNSRAARTISGHAVRLATRSGGHMSRSGDGAAAAAANQAPRDMAREP